MHIRPVNDRITVRKIEAPNRKGLIIIPETAKDPQQVGEVISIGPGRAVEAPRGYVIAWGDATEMAIPYPDTEPLPIKRGTAQVARVDALRPPMQVKPGDFVLFGKYAGASVQIEGKDVFVLREDEVLGVLEDYAPPTEEEVSLEQPA